MEYFPYICAHLLMFYQIYGERKHLTARKFDFLRTVENIEHQRNSKRDHCLLGDRFTTVTCDAHVLSFTPIKSTH